NRGVRLTRSLYRPFSPRPPLSTSNSRRSSGLTTTTDTCSRHTRASRRGGHRTCPGSKPIVQNGLPNHVLPESPFPGQPTLIQSAPTAAFKPAFSCPELRAQVVRWGRLGRGHGDARF